MSLEQAIQNLADAINALANNKPALQLDPVDANGVFIMNLDDLGQPTKFKSRCSICNELGRNSRTCQPTPDDSGSYHWKVVQE
jgi:uncharacterized protein CbrC (UPF0167 family)